MPYVRRFDGVNDTVALSIGGLNINAPLTLIAVCRVVDNSASRRLIRVVNSGVTRGWALTLAATTGIPNLNNMDSAVSPSTMTVTSADDWVVLAVAKASGTVKPRFHKLVLGSGVWEHEDATGTLANITSTDLTAVALGGTTANWWKGDFAAVAVFSSELGDAAVEALSDTLQSWIDVGPVGLWRLSDDPVDDLTGNGANQTSITGTTVENVASFGFGGLTTSKPKHLLLTGCG